MHNYSIMPLDTAHLNEICEDIRDQYARGIASCALFVMTLVPEDDPVIDKAAIMCEKYDLFRDRLAEMGLKCGVLVQASIGHGYPLDAMFPFERYVNLSDGEEQNVVCPYDEGFRKHFFGQMATIAKHRPEIIMLDDDFRLMWRSGRGCACKTHMKRVAELYGKTLTREEMLCSIEEEDNRELRRIFYETQGEALLGAARAMRAGIDSVDPTMPGCYCGCGNEAEFAGDIAQILAGEGNPVIVRINNARYTSPGARFLSPVMYRAACQIEQIRGKADVILAETDTCPQNRYSTSAMNLHTHFTASILEGCAGAKHWITRLGAFEPASGKAYRKTLGEHAGFYQALADLTPSLEPVGCRIPIPKRPPMRLGWSTGMPKDEKTLGQLARLLWHGAAENAWHDFVLERLGLPFYFAHEAGGAAFMDAQDDTLYTDEELRKQLSGCVYLSAEAAYRIIARGFGAYLGVDVRAWTGKNPSGEILHVNGNAVSRQMGICEIVPQDESVTAHSMVYHLHRGKTREMLFPGVSGYKNVQGGSVHVFCGTPRTEFVHDQAFSLLNESRKAQLVELLREDGQLPVWYPGDAEICLRAWKIRGENQLLCAMYNIGFDVLDEISLCTEKPIQRAEQMGADGVFRPIEMRDAENGVILQTTAGVLDPVIVRLTL